MAKRRVIWVMGRFQEPCGYADFAGVSLSRKYLTDYAVGSLVAMGGTSPVVSTFGQHPKFVVRAEGTPVIFIVRCVPAEGKTWRMR